MQCNILIARYAKVRVWLLVTPESEFDYSLCLSQYLIARSALVRFDSSSRLSQDMIARYALVRLDSSLCLSQNLVAHHTIVRI